MLNQIKVSGFKSIKDSGRIPLGSLNLLIGRNGSGKSSLVVAEVAEGVLSDTRTHVGSRRNAIISSAFMDALRRNSQDYRHFCFAGDATAAKPLSD
ncbi:MAG TPA: AAA family ATPase [Polyangium sp.]|nr:AAA family ATPase [Polyangium sp.]